MAENGHSLIFLTAPPHSSYQSNHHPIPSKTFQYHFDHKKRDYCSFAELILWGETFITEERSCVGVQIPNKALHTITLFRQSLRRHDPHQGPG